MNPLSIIKKYYDEDSESYKILIRHSKQVMKKAVEIAKNVPELKLDMEFIKEASMLHDIGIFKTNAPIIHCFGKEHYMKHGVIGKKILEKEGLPKHAIACERHVGVGLTKKAIEEQELPLEKKDMSPKTTEEQIICLADKFFSKNPIHKNKELTIEEAQKNTARFGKENLTKFNELAKKYKLIK